MGSENSSSECALLTADVTNYLSKDFPVAFDFRANKIALWSVGDVSQVSNFHYIKDAPDFRKSNEVKQIIVNIFLAYVKVRLLSIPMKETDYAGHTKSNVRLPSSSCKTASLINNRTIERNNKTNAQVFG